VAAIVTAELAFVWTVSGEQRGDAFDNPAVVDEVEPGQQPVVGELSLQLGLIAAHSNKCGGRYRIRMTAQ
jgi:hypothetical protein